MVRYSASVVAPIIRSSPRASIGLSRFAASIAPSAAPAPRIVCTSSTNSRILPSLSATSSSAAFRRCSNSPRYLAPAIMPPRSSATTRQPRSVSGTSSATMRTARPSAMAVLPTPASPISTTLFLRRRERISAVCSISSVRPITGSMRPSAASAVRSWPKPSSAGVPLGGGLVASSGPVPPKPRGAPGVEALASCWAHCSQTVTVRRPPGVANSTPIVPGRWPQTLQGTRPWGALLSNMKRVVSWINLSCRDSG